MNKSKFTSVYLVRHGKTTWNAEGKLQGRGDSPLLESSLPTIRRVADTIRPIHFDLFLRSPLKRVEDSYQLMLPLDISQGRVEPALMEISFGDYNGKKLAEVPADVRRRREADKWANPWPGGESYRDVFERIQPLVQEINQTSGTIGILAHETVNKLLLASLLGWQGKRVFTVKHPNDVIYKIEDGKACWLNVSDERQQGKGYTEL